MRQTIIVNGANSFLGRNLIYKIAKKYFVYAIVNDDKKALKNFKEKNIFILNIKKQDELLLKKITNIIAYIDFSWIGSSNEERTKIESQINNIYLILNNFKIANSLKAKKYICAGSFYEKEYCYFIKKQQPIPEKYIYGFFKNICKEIIFTKKCYCDPVWLQISNVYGINEKSNRFIWNSLNTKERIKVSNAKFIYDFIYLDDALSMICNVIKKAKSYCTYNICSTSPRLFSLYLDDIEFILGKKIYDRFDIDINPKLSRKDFYINKNLHKNVKFTNFIDGIRKVYNAIQQKN